MFNGATDGLRRAVDSVPCPQMGHWSTIVGAVQDLVRIGHGTILAEARAIRAP